MEFNEAYALISKADTEENQKLFVLLKRIEADYRDLQKQIVLRDLELANAGTETGYQTDLYAHPNFTHK